MENGDNIKAAFEIGRDIYVFCRRSKELWEMKDIDRYKLMQQKYPNFSTSYMIPFKYIALYGIFAPAAFKKYLRAIWTEEAQKNIKRAIDINADYVVDVLTESAKLTKNRVPKKKIISMRNAEHKAMMSVIDKMQEEKIKAINSVKQDTKKTKKEIKNQLINFLNENLDN
jgi:hypothetical protein